MKIKITEIEATAEDLRSNRSLSDVFFDILAKCAENSSEQQEDESEEE